MFASSHCLSYLPLKTPIKSSFPRTRFPRGQSVVVSGNRGTDGWDLDSDRVDEDMIVLRKRIQELRIIDESISEQSGWMEWEKEYYMTVYSSDVCELVGFLQRIIVASFNGGVRFSALNIAHYIADCMGSYY
ncbi:uncharacterized protein LOC144571423 [Carex rostrata]